jgi:hypothetical protein
VGAGTNAPAGITLGQNAGDATTHITVAAPVHLAMPLTVGVNIGSATSITPVAPIHHVTGTTTIQTINVPTSFGQTGNGGCIVLIPDGLWSTNTSGNIAIATTAIVSRQVTVCYDNGTSKWYPSY